MHSIPLGTIRKQFLLCKNTKKTRYVRSLGKKPHFGAFPEAQKGVVIYAICLRKAAHSPIIMQIPRGLSEKKSLLCRKSAILSIRWKKPHFGAFPEAQKANWRSQLRAQSSQMHSIPLDHPKTIPIVQKHKEDAICAILREKTHFGAFPEAQKGVVIYAICLRKAAHSPNNNANPSGLSEKKVYCVESLRFCR